MLKVTATQRKNKIGFMSNNDYYADKNLNVKLGKNYVYLLIMGMGNVTGIVRDDLGRVKS